VLANGESFGELVEAEQECTNPVCWSVFILATTNDRV